VSTAKPHTAGGKSPEPDANTPAGPVTPAEAALREALKLMDRPPGLRTTLAVLAAEGQARAAAQSRSRPGSDPGADDPSPAPSPSPPPLTGGAASGAAGAASSGGGSALYALLLVAAAFAGGLWSRLQLVPVRWRSVAIVALNERPG
jgi:hypothetical protein